MDGLIETVLQPIHLTLLEEKFYEKDVSFSQLLQLLTEITGRDYWPDFL